MENNTKGYRGYRGNKIYNWNSFPNEEKKYLNNLLKTGKLSVETFEHLFPSLLEYNSILTKIMNYNKGCNDINKQPNQNIGEDEIVVLIPMHGEIHGESQLGSKTQLIHITNVDEIFSVVENKIMYSIIQNSYKMHGYLLDKNGCKSDTINLYINMFLKKIEEINVNNSENNNSENNNYENYNFIMFQLYQIHNEIKYLSSIHLNKYNSKINTPLYKITPELNTIIYFFKKNPDILYTLQFEVNQNAKKNYYTFHDIETIIRKNILNGETSFLTIISLSCRNVVNSKKVGHSRKISKNMSSQFYNQRLNEHKLPKIKKIAQISRINKKLGKIIDNDISIFMNDIKIVHNNLMKNL